jgi:outer membrane protein assembly factor BamB
MRDRRLRRAAAVLGLCVAGVAMLSAENWPQFRGPGGQGISAETGLPLTWSATANVAWKTRLPGPGHSSPVIWGDRVFLTAFEPDGSVRNWFAASSGRLLVLCLDRRTGRVMWQQPVPARRIESLHATNSPASPTPVTDGRLVIVHFGSAGLFAFTVEGQKVWEVPLGPFPNDWGSASSPLLYGNLVLLNSDTDGEDFLLAVDKQSGRTVWKKDRSDVARSWPTPFVWSPGGRDQIVVSGSRRVTAYDPADGRELWAVDGLTQWVSPSPAAAHGLLFVASNGPGGNVILAIRPGGRGNVTSTHVAWRFTRSAPYNSSPVVNGEYLYVVKNGGVMTCLNARTGTLVWQQRLPAGGDYYASLVAADGRIHATSEDGVTTVLAAKGVYEPLASNAVGERTMATPAISNGQIFIRTDEHLFAIGTARSTRGTSGTRGTLVAPEAPVAPVPPDSQ